MINLEGKTALVTGGGAGMGRAIAEAFGAYGMRVVIAEIKPEWAEAVSKALTEAEVDRLLGAAKKALPEIKFEEAWQNLDRDGKLTSYEVRGRASSGKIREVRVSTSGEILESQVRRRRRFQSIGSESIDLGMPERTSNPSCVTRTSSSIRIPPQSGR